MKSKPHFPLPHELGERITDPAGLVAEADEVAQAIGADAERSGEHIYVAPARILAQTAGNLTNTFRGRRTDFEVPAGSRRHRFSAGCVGLSQNSSVRVHGYLR